MVCPIPATFAAINRPCRWGPIPKRDTALFATTVLEITRNNARVARAAGTAMDADGVVLALAARPHLACALILLGTLAALTLAKALLIAMIGS